MAVEEIERKEAADSSHTGKKSVISTRVALLTGLESHETGISLNPGCS